MHLLITNLFALSMILMLISHGVIQFGIFELFQAKNKTEISSLINNGVPVHQQVVFSFEINEYAGYCTGKEWKEADEFRYNDKLFDVIKTEISGDSIYLVCVYDSNETELFCILDKIIDEDSENPDEENGLNNYLSHYYFSAASHDNSQLPQDNNNYLISLQNDPLDGEYLVLTPPPRA